MDAKLPSFTPHQHNLPLDKIVTRNVIYGLPPVYELSEIKVERTTPAAWTRKRPVDNVSDVPQLFVPVADPVFVSAKQLCWITRVSPSAARSAGDATQNAWEWLFHILSLENVSLHVPYWFDSPRNERAG